MVVGSVLKIKLKGYILLEISSIFWHNFHPKSYLIGKNYKNKEQMRTKMYWSTPFLHASLVQTP